MMAGEEPVVESGARPAHVQISGRGGCKTDSNFGHSGWSRQVRARRPNRMLKKVSICCRLDGFQHPAKGARKLNPGNSPC